MKTALVIASIREQEFRTWLGAWWGDVGFPWDVTVLVQDGDGPKFSHATSALVWDRVVHYTWDDIGRDRPGLILPEWLSRRDSGIKAWGFLKAVTEHQADVVLTLDDDCYPGPLGADWRLHRDHVAPAALFEDAREHFVERHLAALFSTRKWTTTIPGFNPRGLPYGMKGGATSATWDNSLGYLPVVLNMGVWETIPDRDAVHELTNYDRDGNYKEWKPRPSVYRETRVLSPQQFWPLCGMNLAFRCEIAPLLYFPRMGAGLPTEVPFRRFDDIWCGVIAQKCLAHLDLSAAVGKPIVSHRKASNPLDNLVNEAPGIRANEQFWRVIDDLKLSGAETPLECMIVASEQIGAAEGKVTDPLLKCYLPHLGKWMEAWTREFSKAGWI
jgi:hypothetical protein